MDEGEGGGVKVLVSCFTSETVRSSSGLSSVRLALTDCDGEMISANDEDEKGEEHGTTFLIRALFKQGSSSEKITSFVFVVLSKKSYSFLPVGTGMGRDESALLALIQF